MSRNLIIKNYINDINKTKKYINSLYKSSNTYKGMYIRNTADIIPNLEDIRSDMKELAEIPHAAYNTKRKVNENE